MPAGGGIIQIAAIGRQNDVINKNPNFTLFKTSHNKYTSFAEDFEWNDMNGVISFGAQKAPSTISRYGDLITDLHLWVSLPPLAAPMNGDWNAHIVNVPDGSGGTTQQTQYYPSGAYWVNAIGYALINEITLEIGSQDIDTLYADYMFLWEELTQRPGARIRESIGRFDWSDTVEDDMIEFSSKKRDLFIQIPFFFNKYFLEKGLAIPLISLTYHEVKIKISFASVIDVTCVVKKTGEDENFTDKWILQESGPSSIPLNTNTGQPLMTTDLVAKLLVTYIYLDVDERNAFSQNDHEIVVTILQKQQNTIATSGMTQDSLKLYFNHPSNFLLWVVRPQNFKTNVGRRRYSVGYKDWFDYSAKIANTMLPFGDIADPISSATLKLNSHERWPEYMTSAFFRVIQPLLKFENVPSSYLYVFCFSIAGGVWNPTSTLNFSRIEHTQLDLKYNTSSQNPIQISDIILFVESYNLLVVKQGMAGLLLLESYNLMIIKLGMVLNMLVMMYSNIGPVESKARQVMVC